MFKGGCFVGSALFGTDVVIAQINPLKVPSSLLTRANLILNDLVLFKDVSFSHKTSHKNTACVPVFLNSFLIIRFPEKLSSSFYLMLSATQLAAASLLAADWSKRSGLLTI